MRFPLSPEPDRQVIEQLADVALRRIPAHFREQLSEVAFQVVDFATDEQLASVGLDDPWHLSGLYEGVPLTKRSIWDPSEIPPRVWLFRMPLLAEWRESGVDLADLVRHVVIHEAGHHFGFSDDDMHALEDQAD